MEPQVEKKNGRNRKKPPGARAASPAPPGPPNEPPNEPPKKPKKKKVTTFARQRERRLQGLVQNFELVSLVCHLHVQGATVKIICRELKKKFPKVLVKREDPGWIIRWAARPPQGWLEFRTPIHLAHCAKIRDLFAVHEVEVVRSSEVAVIAKDAAGMLIHLLRSEGKDEVHVGVAGGHTISALMKSLAKQMGAAIGDMPKIVHFHALAAGFDPEEPITNPNAFITFFDGKFIPTKIRFTGLSAPAMVEPATYEKLKARNNFRDILEAFAAVRKLDIVVTSGSTWHACAVLCKRMTAEDRKTLERLGVVGDLLWRPISRRGPIEAETERAFTLIELKELQEFVKKGKKVLVALSPCGLCGALKGDLLECILKHKIVSHVVVDARSAGQMLGMVAEGNGGV